MSVCEPDRRDSAGNERGAFAGLELQHDLYLTLTDWTAWEFVSSRLIELGADLQSLQISRQGDGFSARCRVKRLSSEAARDLSGGLLDAGVARQASVEHLMLAKPAAGAP
ncbi:MAG: hypothetical protein ACREH4_07840 [Vitreimonas sp.]